MAVTDPVVTAADGHEIRIMRWEPSGGARALATVQILHGLGEHVGRYQRFAARCCAHGFAVVGHDHRGHGPGRDPALAGHFADSNAEPYGVRLALAGRRRGRPVCRRSALRHAADEPSLE